MADVPIFWHPHYASQGARATKGSCKPLLMFSKLRFLGNKLTKLSLESNKDIWN